MQRAVTTWPPFDMHLPMSPLIFISVFFATLCIDALYALYTIRVTEKKAFQSATFGSLIHILTALLSFRIQKIISI